MKKATISSVMLAVLSFALIGSGCALTGRQSKVGMSTYILLPSSTRKALENRDLEGITFYTVQGPLAERQPAIGVITSTITQEMLDNGAYRSESSKNADLLFTISKPVVNNPDYIGLSVELKDRKGNLLLSGNYVKRDLSDNLSTIISSLGTERRNKLLAGKR